MMSLGGERGLPEKVATFLALLPSETLGFIFGFCEFCSAVDREGRRERRE